MTFRLSILSLGLAAWLTTSAIAADVEVLARGPVHEGYAEPAEREPAPTPTIPKEPPKPIEELPPDQKPAGDNVQWIPGYYSWDEEKKDYIWISGFWRNAPPGRSWVPGSWRKNADGWQWSGGFWADAKGGNKAQLEYLPQPPKPLDDAGPATPAPSEKHVYVNGSWVWRDRYVWQPGYWSEYRPGWVWIPAHYRWSPAGYVFIDGYWDYPLAERGILFAPVYIPPAVYVAPAFVYTPTVVVREECLFGAFFCRRGFGCYYFGDYFAPHYASFGFVAWCGHVSASITIGGWHDPLFAYYSCGFRHDPFWRGGCVDLYVGRFRGDYMRPPTTLVKQTTVINNITNVNNSKNINLNNVTMVSSLNDVAKSGKRNLTTISTADRQAHQQAAHGVLQTADRRATAETQLASKPADKNSARSMTLDVPHAPIATRTGSGTATKGIGSAVSGPTPTPVGKVDPKAVGSGLSKNNSSSGVDSIKIPPKTPTGIKSDATPHVDPKLPGINPLPKSNSTPRIDLPKGPISPPPPPKPVSPPPPPKPATLVPKPGSGSPPAKSPPKSNKTSSPIPGNLSGVGRAGSMPAPVGALRNQSPSFARAVAPPAVARPMPRPAAPAYSRAPASNRSSVIAPARPVSPKQQKK